MKVTLVIVLWGLTIVAGLVAGYYGIIYTDSALPVFVTSMLTYGLGAIAVKSKMYGRMWLFRKDALYTTENVEKALYGASTALLSYWLILSAVWG